jgi:hypothetical protein
MKRKNLMRYGVGVLVIAFFIYLIIQLIILPTKPIPVQVVGVVVNDSTGNNNGRLNPGESVRIQLKIKNIGQEIISQGEAILFTTQGGVNLIDSVATFPELAPGDSAFPIKSDDFAFSIDDTVSARAVAFYIKATRSPDLESEGTASVANWVDIYACIENCEIVPGSDSDPELVIKLSICNNSCVNLVGVAAHIPADEIQKCDQTLTFTAVVVTNPQGITLDKVFYQISGNVNNNICADPDASPTEEFRYTITQNVGSISCIYFPVRIYTGATRNPNNNSVNLSGATMRNELFLGYSF